MAKAVQPDPIPESGSSNRPVWRMQYGAVNATDSTLPALPSDSTQSEAGPSHFPKPETDRLATEEPMEVRLRWNEPDPSGSYQTIQEKTISITMRTPGHDLELALGFLISEGILSHPDQLKSVVHDNTFCATGEINNTVRVDLNPNCIPYIERLQRHFYTTSSCGVCGKASLEAVRSTLRKEPTSAGPLLTTEQVIKLPGVLLGHQDTFQETGGLHAAGLFDANQQLIALREDVGRHNAVDKVVGWAFQHGLLPLHNHSLMLSGRASFELIQKAVSAGIPLVAAVGAPSSLAVDLAKANQLTLLGFVRNQRFNVYCGMERIIS